MDEGNAETIPRGSLFRSHGRSRGRERMAAGRWRACSGAAVLALSLALLAACSGGGPKRACLTLQASPSLNLHDGQAHATVVFLYPLRSVTGFDQAPVEDLLRGESPPGLSGSRIELTVLPDGVTAFRDDFDAATTHIGILADYYREDDDPARRRKTRVRARCGWFGGPTIVLSRNEILSPTAPGP